MRAKLLVIALALTAATPAFVQAATKKKAAPAASADQTLDHNGPIPYSDLAAADAKLNAPAPVHAKKHMMHKKAAAPAAAAPAAAPAAK